MLSALTKAFIPATSALLRTSGSYLEVGKNNIWSQERMVASQSPFRLVAADYQPVEWTHRILCELTARTSRDEVLPLSIFRFETAEIVRAFSELRRGDHIGRWAL